MKTIFIFPTILLALFNRAGIVIRDPVPFKTVSISPLYYEKNSMMVIDTSVSSMEYKLYITNDMYTSKLIKEGTTIGVGKKVISFTNDYTRSTNQIFLAYRISGSWTITDKVTVNPVIGGYKTLSDNQSFNSSSNVNVYTHYTKKWTTHKVNYSFTNFDGLYIPDYYHKIDLSDFKVNIAAADRPLCNFTASLMIANVNGAFNDISTNKTVEFPLKTVATDTGYNFELQDVIYVHKETLLLSKTKKTGYVATKHIFLPRNDMQNQSKYKAYFSLYDFGIDKDYVRHNFELHALKNIIGDCRNSEYCIERIYND